MIINDQIKTELEKVSEIAGYLWSRGWSERNAGNISINLTGLIDESRLDLRQYTYKTYSFPERTAGMIFFVTGTGERLRDLVSSPEKAACIILIDNSATGYYKIWGGEGNSNFAPTSELKSHLAIHILNIELKNNHRCVLHTHPTELIAISHHKELGENQDLLNKALWSMLPEVRVFVPKGIFLAPYKLPGSEDLAKLTVEGLTKHNVILWSKHGALATGKDIVEAFDFIDVANKGALIYLKCLQAGYIPEGLSDEQMKDLETFIN